MKQPVAWLIEKDCLEAMPDIPDSSIDMILCDLPYGTTQNNWDSVIPLEKIWANYRRILACASGPDTGLPDSSM